MTFSARERWALRRIQMWMILHHGHGHTGHAYNFLLILFILLSLGILPLEFLPALSPYHGILTTIEVLTTACFTVDYALHLYAAPRRWRYVFSFFGIVDLFSILPFYLGFFGTQYLRALRLVRLLRIGEIEAAAGEDEHETMQEQIGLVSGERVEYVVTRHPVLLFLSCIPSLLATTAALAILFTFPGDPIGIAVAVTLFLFALVFLWKGWLDFGYDVIYVTTHRLIFVNQHILGRSINQVHYHSITNVKPSYPSVFSFLLRYGTIVVDTPAAETGHIELTTVRDHEKAAHIIMQHSAMAAKR